MLLRVFLPHVFHHLRANLSARWAPKTSFSRACHCHKRVLAHRSMFYPKAGKSWFHLLGVPVVLMLKAPWVRVLGPVERCWSGGGVSKGLLEVTRVELLLLGWWVASTFGFRRDLSPSGCALRLVVPLFARCVC